MPVYHSSCTSLHLWYSDCLWVSSTSPPRLGIVFSSLWLFWWVCSGISIVVLSFISLMTYELEHLFIMFVDLHISSFLKCLFKSYTLNISLELPAFFLFSYKLFFVYSYIFYTVSSLSDIYDKKSFLQTCGLSLYS